MLKSGLTKKAFYCPGTAPKFTDVQNWAGIDGAGTSPSGNTTGAASTLWGFGMTTAHSPEFHVVGYAFAFSGSGILDQTNQNTTLQSEPVKDDANWTSLGISVNYGVSDRVLVADATLSDSGNTPGYQYPDNIYNNVGPAGFQVVPGTGYNHVSAHLNGVIPAGGFVGYKDGSAEWRLFQDMVPRTTSGSVFWW
jgi:hypothetical protein